MGGQKWTFRSLLGVTGIGMLAVALAGCGSDNPSGPGRVRVLHAAPAAPSVDVATEADEEQVFVAQGLSFGSASDYTTLEEGTYTFQTLLAGSEDAVAELGRKIAGEDFTIIVRGIDDVVMQIVTDASEAPEGQVRIRVAHAAEGVGSVSVYDHTDPSDRVRIANAISYGGVASYRNVAPGAYVFGVDTDGDGNGDVFFELNAVTAGSVVTAYIVIDGDDNVSLLLVDQDGNVSQVGPSSASVRVQNAVPDAPAGLDFYNGDTLVSANVLTRAGTDYAAIEGFSPEFRVTPNGEAGNVLLTRTETLAAGRYTFVVFDEFGDDGSGLRGLLLRDDYAGVPDGQARIRLVHAAHTAGGVDVYKFADSEWTMVATNVGFGTAAPALDVDPAPTIGLDVDRDGTVDLSYTVSAATAGSVLNGYFMFDEEIGNVVLVVKPESGSTTRISPAVE